MLKAAATLAASPYKAPDLSLPSVFTGLTFEQYAAIRRVPGTGVWANEKLGFSLEPLHRGFVYTTPVTINIVEGGLSQRLIYDPADYDFGKLKPPASVGDIGFSGLRILSASDQGFQDAAIFQGASFYRSRARGQNFGVTARGLAIRTGDDPGEEFPTFREFWVEKPAPATNTLTMYALLDSAERHRRVSLHHPSARHDDHRHRDDADRPRHNRQARRRRHGGRLSVQRP